MTLTPPAFGFLVYAGPITAFAEGATSVL